MIYSNVDLINVLVRNGYHITGAIFNNKDNKRKVHAKKKLNLFDVKIKIVNSVAIVSFTFGSKFLCSVIRIDSNESLNTFNDYLKSLHK